ncbi:uncharacterized protein LOC18445507 isoform X2 [Amborella trichopoda]|nr:uncharacterized protein LOC18445507 isoform X2 [Amborella trichopoda]|eukprot:XP_006855706.2 uncharacterized protein LOC18445507 isoform X2 [Amborella trichopoda]
MKMDDAKEKENTVEGHMDEDFSEEDTDTLDKNGKGNEEESANMPSCQAEEEVIKKKYGGIIPKKPPLISKDHERAFFDSADWALGKQGAPAGQKPKGPLEALRPKLQPTPHQQVRSRRSAYARADGEEGGASEDPSCNE